MKRKRFFVKILKYVLGAYVFCGLIVFLLIYMSVPNKVSVTRTRMIVARKHIIEYARDNQSLPLSLTDVLDIGEDDEFLFDGWGNAIVYSGEDEGKHSVEIISLGSDSKIGGEGKESDIMLVFSVFDESGRLLDEDDIWASSNFVGDGY